MELAGYKDANKASQANRRWKSLEEDIFSLVQECRWEQAACYGRSVHSNRQRPVESEAELAVVDDESWMTTKTFLLTWAFLCQHRRGRDRHDELSDVIVHILAATIPRAAAASMVPLEIPDAIRPLCDRDAQADPPHACGCTLDFLMVEIQTSDHAFKTLWSYVSRLYSSSEVCPTLRALYGLLLEKVAGVIEQQVESWGNYDILFASRYPTSPLEGSFQYDCLEEGLQT